MREISATVTGKGQVTIPVEVRRLLRIEKNQKIAFVVEPKGKISVKLPRYPTIASSRGFAGKLSKPISIEEMVQIAREEHLKNKLNP